MKKEEFERRCQKMREANSKESAGPVTGTNLAAEGKPLTVRQVAQKLGRSEWWARTHFKKVLGALVMSGSGKRGTRQYRTVTVPVDVFERELSKFRVK